MVLIDFEYRRSHYYAPSGIFFHHSRTGLWLCVCHPHNESHVANSPVSRSIPTLDMVCKQPCISCILSNSISIRLSKLHHFSITMHSLRPHDLRRIHFFVGHRVIESSGNLIVLDKVALDVRGRLVFKFVLHDPVHYVS